jgi:hypothetical protein
MSGTPYWLKTLPTARSPFPSLLPFFFPLPSSLLPASVTTPVACTVTLLPERLSPD